MNFNATNNTFRQLMGNGLSYRVPLFQPDYSWGPDEWDDLWRDIVALFGDDSEPAHYMGYLVLQSADNRAFDIIDGQQRMTTLSLLMLAAVSHLSGSGCAGRSDRPADAARGAASRQLPRLPGSGQPGVAVEAHAESPQTTASTRITSCCWSGCRSGD